MTNLHPLQADYPLPQYFTNPFDYTPHPLVRQAAEEVSLWITTHNEWAEEIKQGKMFGVLVVEEPANGKLYYLAAFSGLLNGQKQIEGFVPPIFDALNPLSLHFVQEQMFIDSMNKQIESLKTTDTQRKPLIQERCERSQRLQDWIFKQYHFNNAQGETRNTEEVFKEFYLKTMIHIEHYEQNAKQHHIPSGAGDCCAPKLLQYAFLMHLKPLCMGEWWMGASPKGEIRNHGQFYTACMNKCRPILHFMLQGLPLETGPRKLREQEAAKSFEIIDITNDYIVVYKPSGILSVPGRDDTLSAVDCIKQQSEVSFYYPAHRLDQDTSGILIVARTEAAYRDLQLQFQQQQVEKTYTALLDGHVANPAGEISLPLRPDSNNRPMQMVDHKHGKKANTLYQVNKYITLSDHTEATLITFKPKTGRTHQLRIHAAYTEGLGCPILGDRFYGHRNMPNGFQGLCLHASSIRFRNPFNGSIVEYTKQAPFLKYCK